MGNKQEGIDMKKIISVICIGFLSVVSCQKAEDGWQGSISSDSGVTVVKNPVDPIYGPDALTLEEELTIGAVDGPEEYMFQQIRSLAVDDNAAIFVLDYGAKNIKYFNKEGEHIRTFSREGQGPGEVELPNALLLSQKGDLYVADMSRLSHFTAEGDFIDSIPLKGMMFIDHIDQNGNFYCLEIDHEKMVYELKKFDPEMTYIRSFGESPLPTVELRKTGKRNAYFSIIRGEIINGNQVLCGHAAKGYILNIFDAKGRLLRRIEKDYNPVPVKQEHKDAVLEDTPNELRETLTFPDHFPPFRIMKADDEGRFYVMTYEKSEDENRSWHDVFDAAGRFITRILLKARPLVIRDNKLYCIEEDEDGYQFVKRYNMIWNFDE